MGITHTDVGALTPDIAQTHTDLRHSLRRFDVPIMILSALISLDMVGEISSFGGETFTWLVVLALLWMVPYGLVTSELGSAFPDEGGLFEWVKRAFGRLPASVATVMYWSINPLWIGGSLAFISTEAWSSFIHPIDAGTGGDYVFKTVFVLIAAAVTLLSMRQARAVLKLGTYLKLILAAVFLVTTLVYGIQNGFHGIGSVTWSPTLGGFLGLVPLLLFSLVGFEVPSQAGGEMQNPQRDVPRGIAMSGFVGLLVYGLPVLALLLVLPTDKITGIGGFMAALDTVFGVYGSAASILVKIAVIAFIVALGITGATWAMAANRALAVAAGDGGFFPFFAKFDARTGSPLRVGVFTGAIALAFMVVGVVFSSGDSAATFTVVLTITISTSLIAYLFVFPAALRLRLNHADTPRPYAVPGGTVGMAIASGLATFWAALGVWVAVFPGTLESLFGLDYAFLDTWKVSRIRFEVFTLGTLAVLTVIAVTGYLVARASRSKESITSEDVEAQLS
ncbi:APC family permease [Gordonia otitidis]|uniref:APC family permease n=1 Tax=Gordonia otitidis TaxID=249058 RepID=UPI001D13C475|nr:APC family permease [Gordonia otitidis]UEA58215.1 APC family permease [Gordonia otitidis]